MASEADCSLEIVRQFILSNGGKVRNPDLVSRFKRFLNDPENKVENRSKFKDYVNTLATIKVDETGEKILRLKKKHAEQSDGGDTTAETSSASSASFKSFSETPRDDVSNRAFVEKNNNVNEQLSRKHVETKPNKNGELNASMNDELANMSVMERAKHLNKIQTESDLMKAAAVKRRDNKTNKLRDGDDDETGSIGYVSLTEAERQWLCTICKADYHPMVQLLSHNPGLAKVKDFTNTALHWAAKHGKPEVIKMIAGKPNINVNQRSGYTPLHLAAMHNHEDIIELLVQTYKADPNIRDNSGKRPKQYLKNSASSRVNQIPAYWNIGLYTELSSSLSFSGSAELLLARKSTSSYPGQDESFSRSINIRQSHRARAISSLLVSSSSIMKQPYFQGTFNEADDRSSDSNTQLSTPNSTPSSSPFILRRGSARSDSSISQRHSLNVDQLMMPPPSSVPRRVLNLRSSSSENIPNDALMTRTSSDPSMSRPTIRPSYI